MEKRINYLYKGKEYPLIITTKRMKNITYRFRNDTFLVSCPIFVSESTILKGLDKFAPRLLKNKEKEEAMNQDNTLYLFAHPIKYNSNGGSVNFTDGTSLVYTSYDELTKKLKKIYFKVMSERTHYYEKVMGIKEPYKIKIKHMSSRFGSNSRKTHSIQYADTLYPYSLDILDTLIIHELAHHFVFNHSKDFYDIVLKYCPNYYKLNKKLKRREYQ